MCSCGVRRWGCTVSARDERFVARLTRRIGELGVDYARPSVSEASSTLGRALEFILDAPKRGRLFITHYWALYIHDGRGPFGPRNSQNLVWFRDPKQDPRLINGETPARASKLRHLTRLAYQEARRLNSLHLARGGSVDTLPVIVTKRVDRATPAQPFFSNEPGGGMAGFGQTVAFPAAREEALAYLRQELKVGVFEEDTAKGVLR